MAAGRSGITTPRWWHLTLSPSLSRDRTIVAATSQLGRNLWRHRSVRVLVLLAVAAFITFDMVFWGPGLYIRQVLYGNGWS